MDVEAYVGGYSLGIASGGLKIYFDAWLLKMRFNS